MTSTPEASDLPVGSKPSIRIYFSILATLAAVALGYALRNGLSTDHLELAIIFSLLLALAAAFPIPGEHEIFYSLDTIVVLGAVLTLPAGLAMITLAIGCVIGLLYRRRPTYEYIFNSSQVVLQVAAGSVILALVDWPYTIDEFSDLSMVLIAALAGFATLLVNVVAIGLAVRLNDHIPFMTIVKDALFISPHFAFSTYVTQIAGGILAGLAALFQPWLLILIIVPAVAIFIGARENIEERESAEEERHFSQRALAEAQRLAGVGSWQWDFDEQRMIWSDTLKSMLGYSDDAPQLDFANIYDAVHPDDRLRVKEVIQRALEERSEFELEHRMLDSKGIGRTVHHRGEVIHYGEDRAHRLLAALHDITAFKELEHRLAYLAYHDPLTDLPNRTMFMEELTTALEQPAKSNRQLAIFYFDLDFFKRINDRLGHTQGDQLLAQIGERLISLTPESWMVARIGGDEFTLLRDVVSASEAEETAKQLLDILQQSILINNTMYTSTASIGICLTKPGDLLPVEVLRRADLALYQAKRLGRNRLVFYSDELEELIPLKLQRGPS